MTALAVALPYQGVVLHPARPIGSFWGSLFRGSRSGTGSASIVICEKRIESYSVSSAHTTQAEPAPVGVLRRVKQISGLTWEELSKALSVSRRTLHNWDAGTEVSQKHLQHLHRLAGVLERLDRGNPVYLRNLLLKDLGGFNGLAMLGRGEFKEAEGLLGVGQPAFQHPFETPYENLRRRLPQGVPIAAYGNEPTVHPLPGKALKGLKLPRLRKL